MVFVNKIAGEITVKLVYYGAGLSGKTTNVEYLYKSIDSDRKGKMVSLKTDTDRTLFFDFLPLDIGKVHGMTLRVQMFSVPGQVFYDASRRLILKGVDGVVFVVDGQRERMDANIESWENLKRNLLLNSVLIDNIPVVLQYNKMDLKNAEKLSVMQKLFNKDRYFPEFISSAKTGLKVFDTFKSIMRMIVKNIPLGR